MKNNIIKAVGGLALAALLMFNFVLGNNAPNKNNETVSLNNIEALHASAGEAYCDQSSKSTCTLSIGGVTGYSTGQPHTKD